MRLCVLTLLALVASMADAAELRDLHVWDGPESTRVVFDLTAETQPQIFVLSNPERVVIDLRGISQSGGALVKKVQPKGLVQKLRSGPRDDGSLRIVLEVAESVSPRTFSLPPGESNGHRLVLDLYGRTPSLEELSSKPAKPAKAPPIIPITAPVTAVAVTTTRSFSAPVAGAPMIQLVDKPIVIAVDAGHGGEDPGAQGRSGLREKDVALAIARQLARRINEQPGFKAVLTRDGDYFIELRDRVERARKAEADLFVSVHCNAYTNRSLRGSAVYVLSPRGATNEHARWLAHKENSADMVGGIGIQAKDKDLAAVLIDLSQTSTMEASFDVGSRVLSSLGRVNPLQKQDVQQAGFVVLKAPDIPSLLVETAFITNERDERMLADKAYHDKLARALLDGIKGYFQSYRPQQHVVRSEPVLRPAAARAMEVSLESPRTSGSAAAGASR